MILQGRLYYLLSVAIFYSALKKVVAFGAVSVDLTFKMAAGMFGGAT